MTDYLGTPVQMYDERGEKTGECELDVYGKVRNFTGLYYNRFRYYEPGIGNYMSQDSIGLAGNNPTFMGMFITRIVG